MFFPFVVLVSAVLFVAVLLLLVASRAIRASERRSSALAEVTDLRERLHALEDTVAAQEQALNRLTEGQQFTERLLTERAGQGTPVPHRDSAT